MTTTDPTPHDDLATAEAKGRSIDERLPQHATDPGLTAGAPATFMPQAGVGTPPLADDTGPGEEALEIEGKAVRAKIQRG